MFIARKYKNDDVPRGLMTLCPYIWKGSPPAEIIYYMSYMSERGLQCVMTICPSVWRDGLPEDPHREIHTEPEGERVNPTAMNQDEHEVDDRNLKALD